jgi:hypothetical protein
LAYNRFVPAGNKTYATLTTAPYGGTVRRHRTWFSLLSYCVLTALGAALAFALIVAGGSVALASHQNADAEEAQSLDQATPAPQVATTFTGMITDSHCGARHMRKSNMTSAECARACYRKGASYLLVDGNRRFTLIGGESALDKLLGQRASVVGSRRGDTIIVDSAAPTL